MQFLMSVKNFALFSYEISWKHKMILGPKRFGNVKKIKAETDKTTTKVTLTEPPMKEI